ncbi:MAG: type II secretion system protein [Verrucomicrobiota bacterium]
MRLPTSRKNEGLTLSEMLLAISIVGILSGMAISRFSDLRSSAVETVAEHKLSVINESIRSYEQMMPTLTVTVDDSSSADELAVIALLETRDPAIPGSPFFEGAGTMTASANADHYRARWNGFVFELISPGTNGSGLRVQVADGT